MGIAYNPSLVSDGLVLALDAGNIKSYPGSGNTWFDIGGGTGNGTLINSPTFDGDVGGCFSFSGVSQYVSTSFLIDKLDNTPVTIECVFNWSGGTKKPLISGYDGGGTNRWDIQIKRSGNNTISMVNHNAGGEIAPASISPNQWYYLTVVHDAPGGSSKIYINGSLQNSTTSNVQSLNSNATYLEIGDGDGDYFDGKIAIVKLYTTSLNDTQIKNNYQALRRRFGI